MGAINIANSKGRDALVSTESVGRVMRVRWLDEQGRQVGSAKLVKGTLDHDLDKLVETAGALEKVSDALIAGDPEVDMELTGSRLVDASRVYVNPDRQIVHKVQEWEIVRGPDGQEKERRPRRVAQPNVATETPLKWSGKLLKKAEVYNKFAFARKIQIVHVNGLTYDFLYGIARDLEEKASLMLVGSGAKANQPLVFTRGGVQYRGFLEGRTEGEKYCLILHLSNMELKSLSREEPAEISPAAPAAPDAPAAPAAPGDAPAVAVIAAAPDEAPAKKPRAPRKKKSEE